VKRECRFIDDGAGDGAYNMGVDRALQLVRAGGSEGLPTLRLYSWKRPTVTLGRFQPLDAIDADACDRLGVDVVRRPTGGRGVLHDDEVTYCFVAAVGDGVPRGVVASYRAIAEGLRAAFEELGVAAGAVSRTGGDPGSSACYLAASQADLSVGTLKLSGSAQVWAGDTVLQHGSFVITRDAGIESRVLGLGEDAEARLRSRTVTLEEALGARPSVSSVRSAIKRGFESAYGLRLVAAGITDAERSLTAKLARGYRVGPSDAGAAVSVRGSSYA
jgi:lipoate-protein ligase A